MVITSSEQVKAWDKQTMSDRQLDSLQLMERAARAFVDVFIDAYPLEHFERVELVCGPGNNGGDGAAIARLLEHAGYTCTVYGYWSAEDSRSPDQLANWDKLLALDTGRVHENKPLPADTVAQVTIDALFGTGLTRSLGSGSSRGGGPNYAKLVRTINEREGIPVVSVDVPSGQKIDGSEPEWTAIEATQTVTFGAVKLAALLPDTGKAWGEVTIRRDFLSAQPKPQGQQYEVIDQELCAAVIRKRQRFTHKGSYGHVLIIAGSAGHGGAALLSATGAARAGAGLVTVHAPARLEQVLQLGLPEAMFLADADEDYFSECPDLDRYDAIVVGPGLGKQTQTEAALREVFVRAGDRPIVIDADALNLVAADATLKAILPSHAILTPHPGEFERLAGASESGYERLQHLIDYRSSLKHEEQVVVLKDQYTAVAGPHKRVAFNFLAGNPGMATGGMGDTLSGIIGAFAARAESTWEAACAAVYVHAKGGDLAAADLGEESLLASDVALRLGKAFRQIHQQGES